MSFIYNSLISRCRERKKHENNFKTKTSEGEVDWTKEEERKTQRDDDSNQHRISTTKNSIKTSFIAYDTSEHDEQSDERRRRRKTKGTYSSIGRTNIK